MRSISFHDIFRDSVDWYLSYQFHQIQSTIFIIPSVKCIFLENTIFQSQFILFGSKLETLNKNHRPCNEGNYVNKTVFLAVYCLYLSEFYEYFVYQ